MNFINLLAESKIKDDAAVGLELVNSGVRQIFASIIGSVYYWIAEIYNLIIKIATWNLDQNNSVEKFADKIFKLVLIYMIFRITISFLNYLVNPDAFSDQKKGFSGLIKRILISVVVLVSVNPIFSMLMDVQNDIINSDAITSLILGNSSEKNKKIVVPLPNGDELKYDLFFTKFSFICDNRAVITFTQGEHLALLLFRPFFQPYGEDEFTGAYQYDAMISELTDDEYSYCGVELGDNPEQNDYEKYIVYYYEEDGTVSNKTPHDMMPGPNSVKGMLSFATAIAGNEPGHRSETNNYEIDFHFFLALIVGIVALLMLISIAFDIVIRSCTLFFYQVIAPIPIISYISPEGKTSEMFTKWYKDVLSTWASLFIKLASLDLAVFFVCEICDSFDKSNNGFLFSIVFILGALMFAKKVPQLIENVFGIKSDIKLNPIKRIREEAAGGNMIIGAAQRGIRGTVGTATGLALGTAAGQGFGHALWSGVRSGGAGLFGNKKVSDIRKDQAEYNKKMRVARINGATFGGRFRAGVADYFGAPDELGDIIKEEHDIDEKIRLEEERLHNQNLPLENRITREQNATRANTIKINSQKKVADSIKAIEARAEEKILNGEAGIVGQAYLTQKHNYEQMKADLETKGSSSTYTPDQIAKEEAKLRSLLQTTKMNYIDNIKNGTLKDIDGSTPMDDKTLTNLLNTYNETVKRYGLAYGHKPKATADDMHSQMGALLGSNSSLSDQNMVHERNIDSAKRSIEQNNRDSKITMDSYKEEKRVLEPRKRKAQANADMPMRPPGPGFFGGHKH